MSWLLLAFVAPLLWAAVALIDTYFVHGVYAEPLDGAVISGLFQSSPWLLVPLGLIEFRAPGLLPTTLALTAGALFLLSFLAYFTALFVANDGALMQLLWNLTVPVVPLLAWLLIGEQLHAHHYVGIGLAFLGLGAFTGTAQTSMRATSPLARAMFAAIILLALSMVAGKEAYRLTPDGGVGAAGFWNIFLCFCAGASSATLALLACCRPLTAAARIRRIATLSRRYFVVFLLAESISLLGTLASQRAISLAPAVSLVAVIESLVPVFVMLASLALWPILQRHARPELAAYRAQLTHPLRKSLALALIASGIYAIT